MSVFTSFVTDTVAIPGAPGHTATIRKLAPKHLKAAAAANQRAAILEFAEMKQLGASSVIEDIQALQKDEAALTAARAANPLLPYDQTVILQKGILSWTLDRALDLEAIEDLEEETAEALARAILRLTKPALFAAADAGATTDDAAREAIAAAEEAQQKNG